MRKVLMGRLLQIDGLALGNHKYLKQEDRCFYLMDYSSLLGYDFSEANDIIQNLKKPVDRKGKPEWRYKTWAINRVVALLSEYFDNYKLTNCLWVPVPPSKAKSDAMYDDRMVQILSLFCPKHGCDYRELLQTRISRDAAHTSGKRLTPTEIEANLTIDNKACKNLNPRLIILFDDVLTEGSNFRACKNALSKKFPETEIVGVFVGRRI